MEFHEKLQHLRAQKGMTQEVAECLFVSRAAVSKWESGRGYPSVDSLKAIAAFFHVSIDALLSGDEVLTIAQEDQKKQRTGYRHRVFGLLDCGALCYLFLPLFAQRTEGMIRSVSLLSYTGGEDYLRFIFMTFVLGQIGLGILTLIREKEIWTVASGCFSIVGVLLFSLTLQPYGAVLALVFLMIKVFLVIKIR